MGALYKGQLIGTGVLIKPRDHDILLPTKEVGEGLARAFQQALGEQCEPIYQAIQTGRVTPRQLEAFDIMLPTAITESSEERQLYEDLLFARIPGLDSEVDPEIWTGA